MMRSKLGRSVAARADALTIAVVPAYNEGRKVRCAVENLQRVCDRVIVVSDGSTDRTFSEAGKAGATVFKHNTTCGYSAAVCTGMSRALEMGAEIVVTADGDGAHFVDDIPALVKRHIAHRAAMTIGSRFDNDAMNAPSTKRLANVVAAGLVSKISPAATALNDVASGLRVFSAPFAKALVESAESIPPFGLCYYSILFAGRIGQRVQGFPARVRYDGGELLYTRSSEFMDALETIRQFANADARIGIKRLLAGIDRASLLRFELGRRVIYGVPIGRPGYVFQEQDDFYENARRRQAVSLCLTRGSPW